MNPVTEDELHALVDGRLDPQRTADVLAWLQAHPDQQARVDAWNRQRLQLGSLERDLLDEAVPDRFLRTLVAAAPAPGVPRRTVWALAAAMACLGIAIGWAAHSLQPGAPTMAQGNAMPRFVSDAVAAYVVYSPEVRHPVEVAIDQRDHLLQWLSKRLGRKLQAPALETQGFELLGGRLLPAQAGATAQFMYQNGAGERITLYVSVLDGKSEPGTTAFRFAEQDRTSSFYWVDDGFGYAITGQLPRERILSIAQQAYQQLND